MRSFLAARLRLAIALFAGASLARMLLLLIPALRLVQTGRRMIASRIRETFAILNPWLALALAAGAGLPFA